VNDTQLDELAKLLGDRIRAKRLALGYSVNHISERSNIGRANIHKIEAGERHPTTATLFKLSNALDCHVSELFIGMEEAAVDELHEEGKAYGNTQQNQDFAVNQLMQLIRKKAAKHPKMVEALLCILEK